MPIIPTGQATVTVSPPKLSGPPQDPFSRIHEVIDRIQIGSDNAEIDRLTGEANAHLAGVLTEAKISTADPEEYQKKVDEGLQRVWDSTLQSASNGRVRSLVEARVKDNLIRSRTQAKVDYLGKKVDGARANSLAYQEQVERELYFANPEQRSELNERLITHFGKMVNEGVWSKTEAFTRAHVIRERDNFHRAYRDIDMSLDPAAELPEILRRYPHIDPAQITTLVGASDRRRKEREEIQKKEAEKLRADNLLNDTIAAAGGQMIQEQLDIRARALRYTPTEYNQIRTAMESGGTTDPGVYTAVELQILSNPAGVSMASIATNRNLDRGARSTLMNKLRERQDALKSEGKDKHFSKTEEYQQAEKIIRLAASRKGPLGDYDEVEQRTMIAATDELWRRAGQGENPVAVAESIRDRMVKDPAMKGIQPALRPRYGSPEELVQAFKDKRITQQEFNDQALLMKQWEKFYADQAQKAAQPPRPNSRPKPNG